MTDAYQAVRKRREIEFLIADPSQIERAKAWLETMALKGLAAGPVAARLGRPRRNLDQNAKMWCVLSDIAKQVRWHDQKLTQEDWKDLLTATYRGQRLVPGIDGGFVALGMRTSRMRKDEMAELIELAQAFGSERGVVWSEPAKKVFEEQGIAGGSSE